jgi:acyl-CoA synthetase (AMP-forming)/AMP-acid ligase II
MKMTIVKSYWPSLAPYQEIPLYEFLRRSGERLPDQVAVIGQDGSTRTYARIWSDARKVARLLQDDGVKKGDMVGIFSPNHIEYPAVYFGIQMAGATATTLNPLYSPREIEHQLSDAGAVDLFAFSFMQPAAEEAKKGLPKLRHIWTIDKLPEVLEGVSEDYTPVQINPKEDIAALPYSSGTTGLPKGVMLTHYNIACNVIQGLATRDTTDMVDLWTLPLFHSYGMSVLMGSCMARGGKAVIMLRFDVEEMMRLIETYKITDIYLAPPAILAMAQLPNPEKWDHSSLKFIGSGAAPLPPEVADQAAKKFNVKVSQGYGMTETSPTINTQPLDKIRIETVGPPVPDTIEKIVKLGTEEELPIGEVGELMVQGPQVMKGYWNNEKETKACLTPDGWLHTGDVARFEPNGYLVLIERMKEMIKYKGYQVAPAELEALLYEHPAVRDAAVIPKPDLEGGEIPKAFIVLKEGQSASPQDFMTFIAGKVAPYKKIREVEFLDEIPKTLSGKILRRDLIQREREKAAK